MNNFREVLQKVSRGEKLSKSLTREEACDALRWIFEGGASEFQIGAFFAAMRMKGESAEETAGFVEAVRERAAQFHSKFEEAVDLGEPYDGKIKTLHLTVPVALILSAAGIPVVLHSTKDTPVKRGVETEGVLEVLGVDTGLAPQQILDDGKIIFLPTEKLIPNFARLRPYREAFGLRPFANHIEKIFNLANASTQMVGVYHRPYLEPMGKALELLGARRAFVVQGVEGFTEFFISRKTLVLRLEEGKSETLWLDPVSFGFKGEEEPSPGPGAADHAKRITELLQGAKGPARDSILWNAGVKLFWMKKVETVEQGISLAREILDSGKALEKLEKFRLVTQERIHGKKF